MSIQKTEWDLKKHFYNSIEDIEYKKDFVTYLKKVKEVQKYKGKIAELTDEEFLTFYQEIDVLNVEINKIFIFLSLSLSLDTQNQTLQKESAKIEKIVTDVSKEILFIEEEFKQIGFRRIMYYASLDSMKPFKNALISDAKGIQYTLTEAEEKLYLQLLSASSSDMFEELTGSLDFTFRGEKLTLEEVRTKRTDEDRQVRKEAIESIANVFASKQNQIVLSNLYALVCKGQNLDVEIRKYRTVMSSRNMSEEVEDNTVNILLKCVEDNYGLYHKFLGKKAKMLGLEKLEVYDIFAPFQTKDSGKEYSFEEGWKLYIDTISEVDKKLADFSLDMLEDNRISVFPHLGKTGGAYAQYEKSIPEFVLLNWTNSYSDVTTLAHELGHAFHGNLSKAQTSSVYYTPLILAETASIFNETLMFEKLLETTQEEELKKKLIFDRLDDIFGTIFRQVMYVKFEKFCHESFLKNEPMTYDDFNHTWFTESSKLYGPHVNVEKELLKHGWSGIPHIFNTPFYCYTYAFGNIISLNIYQGYKEAIDKEDFLSKYHSFLEAGGSDTPENLLKDIFNIEFNDNFYKLAFSHIEELISKLD